MRDVAAAAVGGALWCNQRERARATGDDALRQSAIPTSACTEKKRPIDGRGPRPRAPAQKQGVGCEGERAANEVTRIFLGSSFSQQSAGERGDGTHGGEGGGGATVGGESARDTRTQRESERDGEMGREEEGGVCRLTDDVVAALNRALYRCC